MLVAWCGRFSPLVGVEEGDNPTSLLLDIGGTAQLFGGERVWTYDFPFVDIDAKILATE